MGDLSWNPATWTPSNLAEGLVEGLTGSEALGDIAGMIGAYATGDIYGLADQTTDIADNVGKGFMKFAEGVWNAAKDAVQEFSNPGSVHAPKQDATQGGYAPGEASGPEDTGQVGQDPSENIGAQIDSIMNNPKLSLETKIFMILLKLQREKREEMKDHLSKGTEMKKEAADKFSGSDLSADQKKEKGKLEAATNEEMQLMQQSASELNELNQMTTNIMKLFHDTKMAAIQNIR